MISLTHTNLPSPSQDDGTPHLPLIPSRQLYMLTEGLFWHIHPAQHSVSVPKESVSPISENSSKKRTRSCLDSSVSADEESCCNTPTQTARASSKVPPPLFPLHRCLPGSRLTMISSSTSSFTDDFEFLSRQ